MKILDLGKTSVPEEGFSEWLSDRKVIERQQKNRQEASKTWRRDEKAKACKRDKGINSWKKIKLRKLMFRDQDRRPRM